MQTLSRGWSFFTQSWKMVAADKDLIKPSIYALLAGFLVTFIFIIPIVIAILAFDSESKVGNIIIGLLSAVLVFAQYSVTYIFSAMTIQLVYGYLKEGDGRMDKAVEMVQRDWFNILTLAAASTLISVIKSAFRSGRNNGIGDAVANLINTIWTEATYIVLPIMVLEEINLKDALKRATYIFKNNLLLVSVGAIGVNWITGIIGLLLAVVGLALGFGIAFPFFSLAPDSTPLIVVGAVLGVFVASIFFMLASVINSYITTAYHTCLYIWARDVEKAQASQPTGTPVRVAAPQPLAAVLGN